MFGQFFFPPLSSARLLFLMQNRMKMYRHLRTFTPLLLGNVKTLNQDNHSRGVDSGHVQSFHFPAIPSHYSMLVCLAHPQPSLSSTDARSMPSTTLLSPHSAPAAATATRGKKVPDVFVEEFFFRVFAFGWIGNAKLSALCARVKFYQRIVLAFLQPPPSPSSPHSGAAITTNSRLK
jgi:hypothetical protein